MKYSGFLCKLLKQYRGLSRKTFLMIPWFLTVLRNWQSAPFWPHIKLHNLGCMPSTVSWPFPVCLCSLWLLLHSQLTSQHCWCQVVHSRTQTSFLKLTVRSHWPVFVCLVFSRVWRPKRCTLSKKNKQRNEWIHYYINCGSSISIRRTERTREVNKKISRCTCNCGEILLECCLDAHLYITNNDEVVWETPLLLPHAPLIYMCVYYGNIMATCPLERHFKSDKVQHSWSPANILSQIAKMPLPFFCPTDRIVVEIDLAESLFSPAGVSCRAARHTKAGSHLFRVRRELWTPTRWGLCAALRPPESGGSWVQEVL